MQPTQRKYSQPRANTFKPFGETEEQINPRETKFPRASDIDRQAQQLKALKLYDLNREFRELILSDEPLAVQKCLAKYTFHSETMEKLSRKKLKILKCGKGIMYLGQVFNDKCHGRGIVVFSDGRLYEGQLENNVRQGEGLYVQPDGSWYFGEFSNDKKDGSGIEVHKGYKYKGVYINGLKHGVGFMVADNIVYSGQWRLGSIHGYGFAQTLQSKYEGTFDKFLKHGEGIQHFKNGDVYKGSYANGKPEGEGNYTWADKSSFQGQFKNGKRNGNGVWRSIQGDQYIGSYENDIKHGEGQFHWKSGNVYKGEFVYDKRQGYGEMSWKDGSYYKGMWSKGIQNGQGELFVPPNKTYAGIFQNNILVVQQQQRVRPMTQKQPFRRRIPIMSAAKPRMTNNFEIEEQFTTQRKKRPKHKELSPMVNDLNYHHRNCPACLQKAKQAAQRFRVQRMAKSQARKKSQSYYVPKAQYTHNHSFRQSPDDTHLYVKQKQYPRIPSRMDFLNHPQTIDSQSKDRSPFKYLRFKFT